MISPLRRERGSGNRRTPRDRVYQSLLSRSNRSQDIVQRTSSLPPQETGPNTISLMRMGGVKVMPYFIRSFKRECIGPICGRTIGSSLRNGPAGSAGSYRRIHRVQTSLSHGLSGLSISSHFLRGELLLHPALSGSGDLRLHEVLQRSRHRCCNLLPFCHGGDSGIPRLSIHEVPL
jgi:hypothetical protein